MAEKNPAPGEAPIEAKPGETPAAGQDAKAAKKTRKAPDAKLAALEQKLEDSQKSLAQANDKLLRTAAEYDNFRRRTGAEKDAAFGNGVAHAAEAMLPILDTLYMAAEAESADAEYKKGVVMTLQKAEEVFKKLGIHEIEAAGQPFDPELHNACMQDDSEGFESGHITKVMQRGYTLNGRVVRHAAVAVKP